MRKLRLANFRPCSRGAKDGKLKLDIEGVGARRSRVMNRTSRVYLAFIASVLDDRSEALRPVAISCPPAA